ncbi:Beta-hexosaminidase-like protein [Emericellopsis cladophorae]|uniref:beta-N-acetylhexosaminidase n=1 Tax=Emericellopsis cladophorae TaxID=2686198 RepID=A0A9Q0BI66_9HYPO|nr:Beta-hexosaminidase-like protein [Emericellopsis cladophorae]KAI6785510.1 Beta-hexosaminidase-like protein [Emericellopsis cladophorae]
MRLLHAFLPAVVLSLELLPAPGIKQEAISFSHSNPSWRLADSSRKIFITTSLAELRDDDGLTLIPPSGLDFAEVLQEDLHSITGDDWSIEQVDSLPKGGDGGFLLGEYDGDDELTYENGNPTTEGYALSIAPSGISILGTGSRGVFWGTRTVLQMLLLNETIPAGSAVDAPAVATRGYMFDAGRKWYTKDFLKEMCSYASFFKMSEFHYHLSDNYPLNRGKNDTWQDVYSHFSLLPEDESLLGIIHGRENETLSKEDYMDMQSHCARRGIAVIPEIEAPGHCLYVTKWKPELSLEKRDLLNLSHPETIPTIKSIWEEFLPWFEVNEVHVGADEYDATLADDYINFVNEMNTFINETSGKRTRIWGTPMDEPTEDIEIDTDIIVQHWQLGQSDPLDLIQKGHDVINSNDWWAYMGIKNDHSPIFPATYPQFFNDSRILEFAGEEGWQWTPWDFNQVNTTQQVEAGEERLKGAILAAWNDNGPDASTKLEMYYAMRVGIALVGARSWSGKRGPEVNPETLNPTVDYFSARAPDQNLDRVIKSDGDGPLVSWERFEGDAEDQVKLGYGSKGMNYTMTLNADGPFVLKSNDNRLSLDENGNLIWNEDGYIYPLRSVTAEEALMLDPGHPGRIWVNKTSTHELVTVKTPAEIVIRTNVEHGAVAWVNGTLAGRFEVFVYGGKNTQFSWSQMAFVAPLEEIEGSGLASVVAEDGATMPVPREGEGGEETPQLPPGSAVGVSVSVGLLGVMALFAV